MRIAAILLPLVFAHIDAPRPSSDVLRYNSKKHRCSVSYPYMNHNLKWTFALAAFGASVFAGCDDSESIPKSGLKQDSTPVHEKEAGMEGDLSRREVESLPADFSIEYTFFTAGVLPRDEVFVKIAPDKDGGYLLTSGDVNVQNGVKNPVVSSQKKLSEAQCLSLYNQARTAGFFGLRDDYEEFEAGGISQTVRITANGSSKTVDVYGTKVPAFDLVVSAIEALWR